MRQDLPLTQGLATQHAALTLSVARGPLPQQAVEAARRLVQHAFGVAAVSSTLPVSAIAREATGNAPGPCLVFGSAGSHAAQDAAFANGATGHASLLEDSGPGGTASRIRYDGEAPASPDRTTLRPGTALIQLLPGAARPDYS